MCSLFIPVFADPIVAQFHFRDPSLDGNFVFGNESYCYVFYPLTYRTGAINETVVQTSSNAYSVIGQISYDKLYAYTSMSANGQYINITFYNNYDVDVDVLYVSYDTNGTVRQSSYKTIPSLGTNVWQFSRSSFVGNGFFSSNIMMDTSMSQFPLANVSFSNDLDYSGQIGAIQSILTDINNGCASIISQDHTYYTMIETFIQDFFNTNWEDLPASSPFSYENWSYMLYLIGRNYTIISNFQSTFLSWYHNQWQPYTEEELSVLHEILDSLTVDVETQPNMENQTEMASAVDEYESAEGQIMGEANSYIDNVGDVIGGFDNQLNNNSIRGAFQFFTFIFTNFIEGQYSIFILIPCIFGLICLVLGRHVQRG